MLGYARDELKHWTSAVVGDRSRVTFQLRVDPRMKPFTFGVAARGGVVTLSGPTSTEVLHAVYTALERLGYRFEVTGPIVPKRLAVERLPKTPLVVQPAVERRGVRQHINFPMDISGYPLAEAKAYVRNLARLRYNWMAFHSYPGHWTWERYDQCAAFGIYHQWMDAKLRPEPDQLVNGAFFYGDHFPIPDYLPVRKAVRFNKALFCAPEVEPVYYTIAERGKAMTHWLGEVMRACKRVGMHVQLSTEIRLADDAYNQGLVDRTIADYPTVDVLEFISREGDGRIGGGKLPDAARQREYLDEILAAPDGAAIDTKYRSEPPDLSPQTKDLAYALRLTRLLTRSGWAAKHRVHLAVGNYAVDPEVVAQVCRLASDYVPKGVWYTLMPGHSSRVVADHVSTSGIAPDLLKRTVVYSWLEFDGYMYLQQLAGSGFQRLIGDERKALGGRPAFAVLCNHWRTGENYLSFRCFEELALGEAPSVDTFLASWARRAGVKDAAGFAKTMARLDELSDMRAIAGNIGFCIKDTWSIDPKERSFANLWWWDKAAVEKARDDFRRIAEQVATYAKTAPDPQNRRLLDLLSNRCECAALHLGAIRLLQDAGIRFDRDTRRMPADLSAEEKAHIVALCDRAWPMLQRYMDLTAAKPVDRGVEGLLIDYYYGPPMLCHNIRAVYGGVGNYIAIDTDADTVPLPLSRSERDQGIKADAKRN